MRIFIAIPLPDDLKESLAELQTPIDGINWQQPTQMHLTLRFLGETENEQVSQLQDKLKEIKASPIKLKIEELDVFPGLKKPRVIWARVEKTRSLSDLQQALETSCVDTGFKPETRTYKPHITLGRVKDADRKQVEQFVKNNTDRLNESILADRFILFESRLSPEGAEHIPLETYQLS